ncbi:MAG: M48 family metallopeptidase [Marinilabiliaceae bacterium]|nr:M48 family metallopeptidase [Marinilabiliaceae bacterium]
MKITKEFDEIGIVLFKFSKNFKRLSISLRPFNGVVVICPKRFSIKKAVDFVHQNKNWILETKEKIKEHEKRAIIFDEQTDFKTATFRLQVQKYVGTSVRIELNNGVLNVFYPENVLVSSQTVQEAIRFGIEKAMRLEAKETFPVRVSQLAAKYGFSYKKVFIKNLKSQWGSCSHINNINLNLHLVRLPEHLIDYMILHELCHTKEKNHGPNFWKLLDSCTDNKAKIFAKEINKYRSYF